VLLIVPRPLDQSFWSECGTASHETTSSTNVPHHSALYRTVVFAEGVELLAVSIVLRIFYAIDLLAIMSDVSLQ
jgi:hypothetical protein